MKRAPSIGTPSIYSHTTTSRSTRTPASGLRSSRSTRSLKIPWYRRPLVTNLLGFDVQRLALYTSGYSFFVSLFTIGTACFDLYCLSEATPGSTHYGYYLISFDFVYVGNKHVRNSLITIAVFSMLGAVALFFATLQLVQALTKEYERQMVPWLVCMIIFAVWRFFGFIFTAVVNDLIFSYNIVMCLFWIVMTILNFCGWASVYSLFLELSDLTKLEDIAHLRMGTLTSLATHSMAGSRPVTPHSPHSAHSPHSTTSTAQLP